MRGKYTILLIVVIYIAFIALGLPDALLGSSWSLVRNDMNVPLGYIGLTTIFSYGFTVLSTYSAPKLLARFQTKQVVFFSLILNSSALIAMSFAHNYIVFIALAIPLGAGAGAIDLSLNHYVAVHFKASHMSYLHSFYGVGVTIGPMIMAYTLKENAWRIGYIVVGSLILFIGLTVLISSKLWFKETEEHREKHHSPTKIADIVKTKGVILSILIFLVYVHIESLFGVLIASYFYIVKGVSYSSAAVFTMLYYLGLTLGRLTSGFVSNKVHPNRLILAGQLLMALAIIGLFISYNNILIYQILILLIGMGSGPIFPNMMHMNDKNFEKRKMSRIMSVQMMVSYMSFGLLTPLMGFVFQWTTIAIFPYVVLMLVIILIVITSIFQAYKLHENVYAQ